MNLSNFQLAWENLSLELDDPSMINDVHVLDYKVFEKNLKTVDKIFAFDLVEQLLMGDAFVLKQACSENTCKDIINWCFNNISQTETSDYKIIEGVPNFHKIINEEIIKEKSLEQIKHSHYFFRWNNDSYGIWSKLTSLLDVAKLINGYDKNQHKSNTNSAGDTNCLEIVRYPSGGRQLEPNTHIKYNRKNLNYFLILNTRGEAYENGGFCAEGQYGDKVDFEMYLSAGDILMHYPTINNYVEEVDTKSKLDWTSTNGKWIIDFYPNNFN